MQTFEVTIRGVTVHFPHKPYGCQMSMMTRVRLFIVSLLGHRIIGKQTELSFGISHRHGENTFSIVCLSKLVGEKKKQVDDFPLICFTGDSKNGKKFRTVFNCGELNQCASVPNWIVKVTVSFIYTLSASQHNATGSSFPLHSCLFFYLFIDLLGFPFDIALMVQSQYTNGVFLSQFLFLVHPTVNLKYCLSLALLGKAFSIISDQQITI